MARPARRSVASASRRRVRHGRSRAAGHRRRAAGPADRWRRRSGRRARSTPRAGTTGSSPSWATESTAALLDRLERSAASSSRSTDERRRGSRWRTRAGRGGAGSRSAASSRAATPDRKEGLYFGEELPADDPRVAAGLPLHGPNLFPARPPALRATVLEVIDAFTTLGHQLMRGLRPRARPRRGLVRPRADRATRWSCSGSSTTRPRPDGRGVDRSRGASGSTPTTACSRSCTRTRAAGSRCATRDGLGRDPAAAGRARLQPRRHARADDRRRLPVDAAPGAQPARPGPDRLPVLLRPGLGRRGAADPRRQPGGRRTTAPVDRWDGASVHDFSGTYGDYLLGKVSKVFPALRDEALGAS